MVLCLKGYVEWETCIMHYESKSTWNNNVNLNSN